MNEFTEVLEQLKREANNRGVDVDNIISSQAGVAAGIGAGLGASIGASKGKTVQGALLGAGIGAALSLMFDFDKKAPAEKSELLNQQSDSSASASVSSTLQEAECEQLESPVVRPPRVES